MFLEFDFFILNSSLTFDEVNNHLFILDELFSSCLETYGVSIIQNPSQITQDYITFFSLLLTVWIQNKLVDGRRQTDLEYLYKLCNFFKIVQDIVHIRLDYAQVSFEFLFNVHRVHFFNFVWFDDVAHDFYEKLIHSHKFKDRLSIFGILFKYESSIFLVEKSPELYKMKNDVDGCFMRMDSQKVNELLFSGQFMLIYFKDQASKDTLIAAVESLALSAADLSKAFNDHFLE